MQQTVSDSRTDPGEVAQRVTGPEIIARRLLPVVVLHDATRADGLGAALVAGGLPVAEVTLRTPAALEAIRRLARRGDVIVGAGTVVTPRQVDEVADAGASFVVSPGFSAGVVERARTHGMPVLPGCVTPTDIMAALALGLTTLKFFPAQQFGGVAALRALGAPFPGVSFVPTGGVGPDNLADYLALPNVPAVGGSWMVPADLVDGGDFDAVAELTTRAVAAAAAC